MQMKQQKKKNVEPVRLTCQPLAIKAAALEGDEKEKKNNSRRACNTGQLPAIQETVRQVVCHSLPVTRRVNHLMGCL